MARPDERRRHARTGVQRGARLIYGPHGYSVACQVHDVSDGGARVELGAEAMLPQTLTLSDLGVDTPARVVWRRGREVGLAFLQPAKSGRRPSLVRRLFGRR